LAGVQQTQAKSDDSSAINLLSVAAELCHDLHMDPMSDVPMCIQLVVAYLCHLVLCSGQMAGKSFAVCSKPNKKRLFSSTTPYQLLLNHFISSIWTQ
jgi:hypothetical protein